MLSFAYPENVGVGRFAVHTLTIEPSAATPKATHHQRSCAGTDYSGDADSLSILHVEKLGGFRSQDNPSRYYLHNKPNYKIFMESVSISKT